MNKYVLLTGATGSLGQVMIKMLLQEGYDVISIGRSIERLEEVRQRVEVPERVINLKCDLLGDGWKSSLIDLIRSNRLCIGGVVNNARDSANLMVGVDGLVSRDSFCRELLLDVVVPYEITMAVVQNSLVPVKSVVNIGSMYGIVASNLGLYEDPQTEAPLHYGVAKSALHHLTKELAVRLAPETRVNCVAFGGVEGRASGKFKERYGQLCPSRKMLNTSDVIGPVRFLLSDESNALTGTTIVADGGWSIW